MKSYAGHFEADGGGYNLTIPFKPDSLKLYNYTKWATGGASAMSVWFRDFAAGDALILQGDPAMSLEVTNGFTDNQSKNLDGTAYTAYTSGGVVTYLGPTIPIVDSATGFAERHATISGATAANPVVLTATAHGFGSTGDIIRVSIENVLGMVELNGGTYQATITSANAMSLQTIADPTSWFVTLGSAVYGADSDEIYFEAFQHDLYEDLGDIA
jgi:hypothetical protein